jgi:excisionase family DNA binding protein
MGVERILTADEVAEYLKVNIRTVYKLLESGELQGRKIGRIWRISESAVNDFVQGEK